MVKIGLTNEAKKGSNRTFMELKFFLLFWSQRCAYRSNRTFMELKSASPQVALVIRNVLIAPLWNWNTWFSRRFNFRTLGSNRTFMELKYRRSLIISLTITSSNRTFMELKWSTHKNFMRRFSCSNRTFMELKLPQYLVPGACRLF